MGVVDRQPIAAAGFDEALIDARAVEVGAPDREVGHAGRRYGQVGVVPVDVGAVDRHLSRVADPADEVRIDARAVKVGAPDRAGVGLPNGLVGLGSLTLLIQ